MRRGGRFGLRVEGGSAVFAADPRVKKVMPYYDEPNLRYDDPLVKYDDPRTYQEILNAQNKLMFDVVLDTKGLTIPDLIQRAKDIKAGIAGNAVFTTLSTKLTA